MQQIEGRMRAVVMPFGHNPQIVSTIIRDSTQGNIIQGLYGVPNNNTIININLNLIVNATQCRDPHTTVRG